MFLTTCRNPHSRCVSQFAQFRQQFDQQFIARLAIERRVSLSAGVASGNSALTSFVSAGLKLRMTRLAHG